jgi:hypothetical protein
MQIEIQGIPQSLKSQYAPRLKRAQTELARWKKLSGEAHTKVQRGELFARGGGFGGATSDEPYSGAGDRTRLLVGHEVLEDGTRWAFFSFNICSGCYKSPFFFFIVHLFHFFQTILSPSFILSHLLRLPFQIACIYLSHNMRINNLLCIITPLFLFTLLSVLLRPLIMLIPNITQTAAR